MKSIIVNGRDKVSEIAEKVVNAFRADQSAEVYAFGPVALNQSVKAIIHANEKLRNEGVRLAFVPVIESTSIVKEEELIIRLSIESIVASLDWQISS